MTLNRSRLLPALLLVAVLLVMETAHVRGQSSSPVLATLEPDRTAALVGESVGFRYDGSPPPDRPDLATQDITIDYGDGQSATQGSAGPSQTVYGDSSHAYLTPGQYQAMLTILLSDGEMGVDMKTIVVLPRPGATLQLQAPPSAQAGQAVAIRYSADPSFALRIAYGDGSSDSLPAGSGDVTHTYAAAGSYAILLTELDASGGVLGATSAVLQVTGP